MLKFLKISFFILLIIFWLNSCNNQKSRDNSWIISTVSVLEKKVENINKEKPETKNNFCNKFIKSWKYYKVWWNTKPSINETHIFCWEYNKRWKPTWFHSKILWIKPETIVSFKIKDKPNKYWVYTAKIVVKNLKWWENKTKFSSIFPDNLSKEEVEKAIINAWKNKTNKYNEKSWFFKWPSGLGFDISWYTYHWSDKINTAFPVYTKN